MNWSQLLNSDRVRTSVSKKQETRSEFQKDYHRIVGSSAFRRLQDKTQVFPLEKSDFIRTRLTHSIEVSSLAKSLGQAVCKSLRDFNKLEISNEEENAICDILLSAGLLHDIGNPPFGHFGEVILQDWFRSNLSKLSYNGKKVEECLEPQMLADLKNFEGNAQTLRIISKLHSLIDQNGMNLTKGLLCTIIKYPCSSTEIKIDKSIIHKKMGYFYSEKETFEDIVKSTGLVNCRHPLTFLLEAADDIAYLTADIEDAAKKGLISIDKIHRAANNLIEDYKRDESELKFLQIAVDTLKNYTDRNKEKLNAELLTIQNWIISVQGLLIRSAVFSFSKNYNEIMEGTFNNDLFDGTHGKGLAKLLSKVAIDEIYNITEIYKLELSAEKILSNLLDVFVPASINYESGYELTGSEKRALSLISKSHMSVYQECSKHADEIEKLYLRIMMVTDFVSGMTDSYAKNLYKELNGLD